MKILLNHLGYAPDSRKTAVIEAPASLASTGFTVYDSSSRAAVFSGQLVASGPVARWQGWHFWTADFSALAQEGEYFIVLDGISPPLVSANFAIHSRVFAELMISDIVHYLKGQRCSGIFDLADRSRPLVGSDERRDVHGGWYDASGDVSKYLSHLSYSQYMNPQQTPQVVWNLIDGLARMPQRPEWVVERMDDPAGPDSDKTIAFFNKWFYERITDEALHGADFLLRMQSEQGYFYMTVFDQWSKDENRRDICEYKTQKGEKFATYHAAYRQGGGSAIAALARASTLGRDGEGFTRAAYLAGAKKGFADLEANNIAYLEDGRENMIDDYCALLAATELLAATGEGVYADAAARRVDSLLNRQQDAGWFRMDDAGERSYYHAAEAGLPYLALLRYLEVVPASPLAGRIRAALEKAYRFEIAITNEVNNPFGYPRHFVKNAKQPGGTQFFIPHDNETGYWWQGENARLGSIVAAAEVARRLFSEDAEFAAQIREYGDNAFNWLLGANPFDACMLQGWGRNNPRYEPGFFNAPGGVCNGITSGLDDEDSIDFRKSEVATMANSWRWTEQWIPHGAWLYLALCSRVAQ